MKKLILLFVVAFMAMFNNFEAKACPSWATNSLPFIFTVDGCQYIATICWQCPAGGMTNNWIAVQDFRLLSPIPCGNDDTPRQILDAIFAQVNTVDWLAGLCINFYPPCPDNSFTYSLFRYDCWGKYNDGGVIDYYVCDMNSWCQEDCSICWDNLRGPIQTCSNYWYSGGNPPTCSLNEPGDPTNPGTYGLWCWQ